jgi:uncharacterized membrane protein
MKFNSVKTYIWLGFYLLSAGFIIYYFYKYFHSLTLHVGWSSVPFLIFAFVLNGAAWFVMASAWAYMIMQHHDIPFMDAVRSFYVSQIVRYIPGNVWSYLARFTNSKKLGVSVSSTAYYFSLENINLIFVSFLFSLLSISFFSSAYYLPIGVGLTVITVLFFIIQFNPTYFKKILQVFAKRFHATVEYENFSKMQLGIVFLFFVGYWLLYGLAFYIIVYAFGGSHVSIITALGVNALAWLIGYLSIVTPSGLGVREAVIVGILTRSISSTISFGIAIISRIVFTVSEVIGLLFVLSYARLKKWLARIDKHLLFVIILTLIYIAYFSFISIVRVHNLYSGRYDLGDMDQTVWTTIHGMIFSMTDPASDHFVSRLYTHADVILILISPLYWIYSSPYTLLVLQSILVGIGAIPLYLLAKKILQNKWISLALVISFFLNPAVEHINFYDFHAVSFCMTFFLFAFYFLYQRKYLTSFIFCIFAILCKEEIGLIVCLLGVYIFFKQKNRKWGILFALTGLGASLFLVGYLIPHFRPDATAHFALNLYGKDTGATPLQALLGIFSDPKNLLANVFSYQTWVYLYQLFFPVGFLSLLNPSTLLLSISEFGLNVLSSNYYMKTVFLQYPSGIIPFIYIATIFGIKKISEIYGSWYNDHVKKWIKISFNTVIFLYVLIFALLGSFFLGILPLDQNYAGYIYYARPDSDVVDAIRSQIPPQYSVSASNSLGSAFSERRNIYIFPIEANSADFILVFKDEQFQIVDNAVITRTIDYLLKDKDYRLIYNGPNLYVWEDDSVHLKLNF